jgi:microcompartment protein CcmL/EutN
LKETVRQALGIIETSGRAPLIEAVDGAIKAAAVTLQSSYFVGGGLNAVTLTGDVGAMRAALDAAQATLDRMQVPGQTHLIPRLAPEVWDLIGDGAIPAVAPQGSTGDIEKIEKIEKVAPIVGIAPKDTTHQEKPRKRNRKPKDRGDGSDS